MNKDNKLISVTPGEALQELWEKNNFSVMELAEKTNVDFPYHLVKDIIDIELHKKEMSREEAVLFAKALNVHPSVLMFPDYTTD